MCHTKFSVACCCVYTLPADCEHVTCRRPKIDKNCSYNYYEL